MNTTLSRCTLPSMSDPRRRTEETTPEPRAKALARPRSDGWRVDLAGWSDDDRFGWLERVAIMLSDAELSEEEAEYAAYLDGPKRRTAVEQA